MTRVSQAAGYRRTIRPNRSLNRRIAARLVVGLGAGAVAISLGALHLGAWPVLPFVAVELLGAGCIAHWLRLHRRDYERVHIRNDVVDVARRDGRSRSCARFPRYWARVRVERHHDLHPPRVLITSHGRSVEVGSALPDEARQALAEDLTRALRH